MRLLVVIFILHVSYILANDSKYAVKNFPKKVKPGSGKMLIKLGKYGDNLKTTEYSTYTRFPIIGQQNVPERLLVPRDLVDGSINQKTRVKKVLPEYPSHSMIRRKRSAETPKPKIESKNDTKLSPRKPPGESKAATKQDVKSNKMNTELKSQNSIPSKPVKRENKLVQNKGMHPKSNLRGKLPFVNSVPKTLQKKPAKRAQMKNQNRNTKALNGVKSKLIGRALKKSKLQGMSKSKTRLRKKLGKRTGNPMKLGLKKRVKGQRKLKSVLRKISNNPSMNRQNLHKRIKSRKSSKKQAFKNRKVPKGKIPLETRRLTAAREALIEDYPYVVSIQKDDQHWCSGALLNPRLVITTANCVWKSKRLSRMEVRAGSSYTDRGGQVVGIQEVRKHPKWGLRKNPDNDVALLLLDEKIKFSHSVHGVDLPNHAMFPAFDDAWVTSWGAERRDGIFERHENHLQVYHAMVISRELCNNITSRFGVTVTENFICLSQTGKTSPCTRDTGAPAVSDGVLWGLASWGLRKLCGTERYPSMFSYIASTSNLEFIANATSYLMSDQRLSPFKDRPPMMRVMSTPENPKPEEIVIGHVR